MTGPAWLTSDEPPPDPHGRGQRAVDFLQRLRLTEGRLAGRRFILPPFQERITRRIYGDTLDDGRRRVRTVFLYQPRGNGKTTFTAGLSLLHLFGPEREAAGQVIDAAADRDQASIAFNAASRMVRVDKTLKRVTRIVDSRKTIHHPASASVLRAISHEATTKHGMSISFLNADEVHAWPTRDLWDVLRTSMGKRDNPLTVITTTAGEGQTSFAWDLYEYARKVATGDVVDPSFLPILFEAPADADPFDEDVWLQCNPALAAGYLDIEHLRDMARQAREVPAMLRVFKQLHLNIWQEGAADPWIDMDVWDEGAADFDPADFEGEPCWLAVDLSSTTDLTVVVAVWKRDETYFAWPWFFTCDGALAKRERADKAPYRAWAADNYLTAIPGPAIDYAVVEARIRDLCSRYDVREISMDPWNAHATNTRLLNDGLPVVDVRQGFATMSALSKETERVIISRRLVHGGHPVLRWCFSNVRVDTDPAGNIKPAKNKSTDRIDGAVALVMAIGRAEAHANPVSVYDVDRPDGFVMI